MAQEQPPHPPEPAAVKKPVSRPAPAPEPVEKASAVGSDRDWRWRYITALLGLFWWRRRKMASEASLNTESMFSPSIILKAPESDSTFSVPALNESTAYDVDPVGESSFLSEFTPSDFDAFDSDQGEIDPISEADVYLAYGRYQQAEELMRNAVTNYPDRDECKLKLLEIYYAAENKPGFEAFAKELSAAGKDRDSVFWGKAPKWGVKFALIRPCLLCSRLRRLQCRRFRCRSDGGGQPAKQEVPGKTISTCRSTLISNRQRSIPLHSMRPLRKIANRRKLPLLLSTGILRISTSKIFPSAKRRSRMNRGIMKASTSIWINCLILQASRRFRKTEPIRRICNSLRGLTKRLISSLSISIGDSAPPKKISKTMKYSLSTTSSVWRKKPTMTGGNRLGRRFQFRFRFLYARG